MPLSSSFVLCQLNSDKRETILPNLKGGHFALKLFASHRTMKMALCHYFGGEEHIYVTGCSPIYDVK